MVSVCMYIKILCMCKESINKCWTGKKNFKDKINSAQL